MSRLVPISKNWWLATATSIWGCVGRPRGAGFVGPNISVAATIGAKARIRMPPLNTRGESSWSGRPIACQLGPGFPDRPVRCRSCWSRPFPRSTLTACVLSQDVGFSVAVEVAHADRGPTRPRIGADQCTTDLMGPVHFPRIAPRRSAFCHNIWLVGVHDAEAMRSAPVFPRQCRWLPTGEYGLPYFRRTAPPRCQIALNRVPIFALKVSPVG